MIGLAGLVDGGPQDGWRTIMGRRMNTSIRTHEGRVALVTGAAQGLGQAIALALAEPGARVIATDLTPPHETVEKIGPTAHAFQLDVTQEEDWRSVSVESRDEGDVDIVVNNAGYFPNRPLDELDLPTWRKTMATNLDSHFLSAKFFLPAMRKKKWGRFVGISSNMVGLAIPGMSHYITTKMGIIGFMRGLANDVASDGITANAVLPGLTNTLATAPQSDEQKLSDSSCIFVPILYRCPRSLRLKSLMALLQRVEHGFEIRIRPDARRQLRLRAASILNPLAPRGGVTSLPRVAPMMRPSV
jgi:NAD(P)-dependent dehydrogenase (short-subunit alcohol dehydrogenase family)